MRLPERHLKCYSAPQTRIRVAFCQCLRTKQLTQGASADMLTCCKDLSISLLKILKFLVGAAVGCYSPAPRPSLLQH